MGLETASFDATARWRKDDHNYQMYRYEVRNMLTNSAGELRLPLMIERERVMGFDDGHYSSPCKVHSREGRGY